MAEDIATSVQEMIHSFKVVIFSKTTCPYCKQAKELFDSLGCKFLAFELDEMPDGAKIQNYLGTLTGARTVPRVFIAGKCIGGASDTQKLHDSGKLTSLLQ